MSFDESHPNPVPVEQTDLCCVDCGYNLTGIPTSGRCPECGLPIAESSVVEEEHMLNGAALTSMVLGVLSLTLCWLLGPAAIVYGMIARRQLAAGRYARGSSGLAMAGIVTGVIGTLLVLLLGVYLLLEP